MNFFNSDLAFSGSHLFMGSFHGFNSYDIENGKSPRLVASVVCPGGQGDMSVYGHLLFMSVEQTRGRIDCGTQGIPTAVRRGAFPRRSNLRYQRPEKAEAGGGDPDVPRLAHSSLVTDPKDPANIYVYGSGYSRIGSDRRSELDGVVRG